MRHLRSCWIPALSLSLALVTLVACGDVEDKGQSSVAAQDTNSISPPVAATPTTPATAAPTAAPTTPVTAAPSTPAATATGGYPHTLTGAPWSGEVGSRKNGEACAFGEQCASGGCLVNAEGGCGQCVEIRGLGQSCDGALQGCSSSADCKAGVCVSNRMTSGASCALGPKGGDAGECDDELYCAGKPGDASGTCAARIPRGEACIEGYDQAPCARGGVCDGKVCIEYKYQEVGESCGVQPCRQGLFCDDVTRLCRPGALPQGTACGVVGGSIVEDECAPGTTCGSLEWPNGGGGEGTLSTCIPLPHAGEPCIIYRCAAGLFCNPSHDGVTLPLCEAPRQIGEACSNGFDAVECAAGLECRNRVCAAACE